MGVQNLGDWETETFICMSQKLKTTNHPKADKQMEASGLPRHTQHPHIKTPLSAE